MEELPEFLMNLFETILSIFYVALLASLGVWWCWVGALVPVFNMELISYREAYALALGLTTVRFIWTRFRLDARISLPL